MPQEAVTLLAMAVEHATVVVMVANSAQAVIAAALATLDMPEMQNSTDAGHAWQALTRICEDSERVKHALIRATRTILGKPTAKRVM